MIALSIELKNAFEFSDFVVLGLKTYSTTDITEVFNEVIIAASETEVKDITDNANHYGK
jgi:hypothetical protein